jgi:ABC-type glycerol-3-phosphate transport system substrate-binding protein
VRKLALKVAFIVLTILLLGVAISAVVVFNQPELMPPGPYHPRALLSELLGYRVHPWVKIDPAKQYTLRVWSTRWPIFRDGYGYDDLIEEVIEEFQKTYSNVNVEYVLLPLGEIAEAIEKAVENSTPPNICIAPFDPSLIESGLVVPINMFICDKPREDIRATPATDFELSSLKSVSLNNRLWAWPSWIAVKSWAGNAEILRELGINVERVMLYGWSHEDILAMVDTLRARQAGVSEQYRTFGLVLDTTSTNTLDTLMEAADKGLVFSQDGSLMWKGAVLKSSLSFLECVRLEKGFPEPVHMMNERMLELFWTGRAAVIGPVGSGFLRHVRERQERIAGSHLFRGIEAVEPVLLPVPHPIGGTSSSCVTLHAAVVFTCPGTSGADTAYLAVRLAEALARKEALWLAGELSIVPARCKDRQHAFSLATVPDGAGRRFLVGAATSGRMFRNLSSEIKEKERLLREQAISPMMDEFWRGTISPDEFDSRLSAFAEEIADKGV